MEETKIETTEESTDTLSSVATPVLPEEITIETATEDASTTVGLNSDGVPTDYFKDLV